MGKVGFVVRSADFAVLLGKHTVTPYPQHDVKTMCCCVMVLRCRIGNALEWDARTLLLTPVSEGDPYHTALVGGTAKRLPLLVVTPFLSESPP